MKKYKYALVLAALLIFQAVNNYIWLKADNESMGTDVAVHVDLAVSFHQGIADIIHSAASPAEKFRWSVFLFFSGQFFWPHFVHLFAALVSFISPNVLFWIRFSNMFYFIILVASIYLLGKKIHSPLAGLLAACFVCLYPGVFGLSRKFGLDFPLLGMICLAMYFLLCSDNFRNRYYSILFGIAAGLGMLIKGQFAFFAAGPFIYTAIKGAWEEKQGKAVLVNIAVSLMLGMIISLSWWHKLFLPEARIPMPISFSIYENNILYGLSYYLHSFYTYIHPVFFAAFFIGLVFYLKKFNQMKLFFLLWCLPAYIFYSLCVRPVSERYIFPVFAVAALISAIGLLEIGLRSVRRTLITLFIFLGLVQFFSLSYTVKSSGSFWVAHSPEKSNHFLIMDEFNRIMRQLKPGTRNIAIIEEDYFSGDPCIRLGYFLKLLDNDNNISLSALGSKLPSLRTSKDFLFHYAENDFVIAFSRDHAQPDFSGLEKFAADEDKEIAAEAARRFKRLKIVKKILFWQGDTYIFLLMPN